jgi:hypothetical protein
LLFHPAARLELTEAARYYAGKSPALAQRFYVEMAGLKPWSFLLVQRRSFWTLRGLQTIRISVTFSMMGLTSQLGGSFVGLCTGLPEA